MYAIIQNRDGHEEARYALTDTDPLDCLIYAKRYASEVGVDTDFEDEGYVPAGCEDFSVTLTANPDNPAVCWNSARYCITWK